MATILLVEDDDAVRTVLRRALQLSGHVVVATDCSEAALEHFTRTPGACDLLVTDVVLPRMGGVELAQRLAALRPTLPILLMSGYLQETVFPDGLPACNVGFLQKPVTLKALVTAVKRALDGGEPPAPPRP